MKLRSIAQWKSQTEILTWYLYNAFSAAINLLMCDWSSASLTSVTEEGSTDHLKTDATVLELKYLKSTREKKKIIGKIPKHPQVPLFFIGLNLQLQRFSRCRDWCIKQAAFLSVALCTACPLAKHNLISWTVLAAVKCLQSSALNCIIINIHVPRKQSK